MKISFPNGSTGTIIKEVLEKHAISLFFFFESLFFFSYLK